MLVSRQLSSRITIDDAQTLRDESRQLCHKCRNIRSVSVLLKETSEDLVTAVRASRLLRLKDSSKETEK